MEVWNFNVFKRRKIMGAHEAKIYPYHLAFLKDFPNLTDWLNCRGYVLRHSHQDFSMNTIYTFWDDRTSEEGQKESDEPFETLTVVYCRTCGVVEVFRRCIIVDKDDEKALVNELDGSFPGRRDGCCNPESTDGAGSEGTPSG
jgi:hypothetical protein